MIGIRRVAAVTALAVVGVTGTAGMAYAGDYSSDTSSDHHHHHDGDDRDHHHRHHCGDYDRYHHFEHDGLLGDLLGFGRRDDYDRRDHRCSRGHEYNDDNGSDFGGFNGNGF